MERVVKFNTSTMAEHELLLTQALKRLSKICNRFLVLKARYHHLKAYFGLLRGKIGKTRNRLLPRCIKLSTKMGMVMESEWAILSKHEWFDRENRKTSATFTYNGLAKFPLPKLDCASLL